MAELTQVGAFCPNPACADYGQVQTDHPANIVRFGLSKAGHQRYQCQTCGQTFTETKGTLFYRRRASESEFWKPWPDCRGRRISSVSRTTGHKEDTLLAWLREAAQQVEAVEDVLLADYRVTRGQLDGLWAYVGNKGEKRLPRDRRNRQFWRSTMIDMDSRLRCPGHRQDGNGASRAVFQTLKDRGHPDAPPPTMSDGWGGIDEAMIDVYGQVPAYQGCGRPPTLKQPQAGWQYLQFVKHRDEYGRLLSTELRVIFGEPDAVLALFGQSTAYIERTHLTMRLFNGRLVRQTLGFSKDLACYRA